MVRRPVGPAPLSGSRPGGGRLSAPDRRAKRARSRAAGLGAGLLRAQRPRLMAQLERFPTGGAAKTDRAKPAFSIIDRKRRGAQPGLSSLGRSLAGFAGPVEGAVWLSSAFGGELYRSRSLRRHLLQGQQLAGGGMERGLQPSSRRFLCPQ